MIITQGFIASASDGATSVLGFEGSDYSAAIFGMALDASRVEIWTDVDGIRSADPRVVNDTVCIRNVSYDEASEMAFLGALAKFGRGMIHGDGNTRQCLATAVTAYKESFGFDAPPFTYADF